MDRHDPFAIFDNDPDGEEGVRRKLAEGEYGYRDGRKTAAVIWLKTKEARRKVVEMKQSLAEEQGADLEERSSAQPEKREERAASGPRWGVTIALLIGLAVVIALSI